MQSGFASFGVEPRRVTAELRDHAACAHEGKPSRKVEPSRPTVQSKDRLELARDDEHDVIGLVKFPVKGLQILNGHAFNIRSIADR